MFSGASSYADKVDGSLLYIIAASTVLFVGVIVAMLYFVWKYNKKKNPVASQIHGNTVLEVVWTVIPLILVMTMFFSGYTDFKDLRGTKSQDLTINVTASMWRWNFKYANGIEDSQVRVPVGKTVKFLITSTDVLHSFYLPSFRIKEDAVPKRTNYIFLTPEKVGSYDIACAEYCGMNHWNMYTKIIVMEQNEYDKWYAENNPNNISEEKK